MCQLLDQAFHMFEVVSCPCQPYEAVTSTIIPISQREKLRLRGVKTLGQGLTAQKGVVGIRTQATWLICLLLSFTECPQCAICQRDCTA